MAVGAHWRTPSRSIVHDHVFHVPVFSHKLQNVLARGFSEFCAEVNIVPEIVDSCNQTFKNERGFVAGHYELTGVIGQTTALKERKRHLGPAKCGGMPELYPSCSCFLTLLMAPSTRLIGWLWQQNFFSPAFRAFSNSSPCCQPARADSFATSQPKTSPNFATLASAVKSMSGRYWSEGW